jgi:hypothetical protein
MSIKTLSAELDQTLKQSGFLKKGLIWRRDSEDVVDVIDLQISKPGDSVTLNCGVLDRGIYITVWGRPLPDNVDSSMCTIRARIGELIGDTDKWWPMSEGELFSEIPELVDRTVKNFWRICIPI